MHNPDPQLDRLIGTAELATLLGRHEVTMLGVGEVDYKTEEACLNANAGTNDTFWCVRRNWLDKGQRKPVRAFVTD